MPETSTKLDSGNELKFSREQGFFDKSFGVRLIIGALFTFCLFSIIHFREVRVEVLELGSIAPSYIVAQTDFVFNDAEATNILKQESIRDLGKIYQISEKEVRQRRAEFGILLTTEDEWRENSGGSTIDEMTGAANAFERALHFPRFSDRRTIQKMNDLNLPTLYYHILSNIDPESEIEISSDVWVEAKKNAFPEGQYNVKAQDFVVQYFKGKKWRLDEDVQSERAVRARVQSQVPDKYTKVSAGSRIIDQGEKVTARHLTMLQAMKDALNNQRNLAHSSTIAGSLLISLILTFVCSSYLSIYCPDVLGSNRKLFLIVTIVAITFGIAKITEFFFLTSKTNLIEVIRYPLFVPFAAILLCGLLNPAIATFMSGFLGIILMISLAFDSQGFIIMNLPAALVAILSARNLRKRKEIFGVCANAWLCSIGVILSLHLYLNTDWDGFMIDVLSSGGFMLLTAVFVVGLLPLLEAGFKIMTDVTLMEYMDPNHDLLRRLSIEAPGTYQHSVVVGNLAEAAAQSIHANGLFCRVATLYHDVGKMATPQYFTENQHGGMNIHQLLTPQESAQVIIAHIAEGVALGRRAGLPEQFIDIIKEHHGTTSVYYFYRKELENMEGDVSKVDVNDFRYAGPTPRSKESAIIMIADSLEAASRSLEKVTDDTVRDLINRIVKEKLDDGQFDHSLLTLEELAVVKETLVKTLVAYGHSRVKYPTRDVGEETLKDEV